METKDVKFPEKLAPLFDEKRYKVIYGGRGKGGSWGMARALLILGYQKPLRVLCTREIQRTISDSVHQLLRDQIELLGLSKFYKVTETEISGGNGTSFLFAGLRQLDAGKLKSLEGCDVAWVEEAENISKKSWNILIPTIRKDKSEIWVNFNPQLDSDETYVRFIVNTPPDTALIPMSYRDNPFFPSVLEKERVYLKETDPESYENVWEGKCRASIEGAIYANEIRDAIENKRITRLPYDPMLKVHTVWDLGFNDKMSIVFVQRSLSEIRIIDFLEDNQKKYDWFVDQIKLKGYNLGKCFLPHDAANQSAQPGVISAADTIKKLGLNVQDPLKREDPEIGIKRLRQIFGRIYFDEDKTRDLVSHLRRYRRAVPVSTNEPAGPVHDEHSHAADAMRYMAMCVESMTNDDGFFTAKLNYRDLKAA